MAKSTLACALPQSKGTPKNEPFVNNTVPGRGLVSAEGRLRETAATDQALQCVLTMHSSTSTGLKLKGVNLPCFANIKTYHCELLLIH